MTGTAFLGTDLGIQLVTLGFTFVLVVLVALWPEGAAKRRVYDATILAFITLAVGYLLGLTYVSIPHLKTNIAVVEELERTPELAEAVGMFNAASDISRKSGNRIMLEAMAQIALSFKDKAKLAQEGRFIIQRDEIIGESINMIRNVKRSILSTSYVKRQEWWDSAEGSKYLKENYDAISRGVKIKRIFIFQNRTQRMDADHMLQDQADHGINVSCLYSNDLDSGFTNDLLIIDDIVAGRLYLNANQEMSYAEMFTKDDNISAIRRDYERLELRAKDVKSC